MRDDASATLPIKLCGGMMRKYPRSLVPVLLNRRKFLRSVVAAGVTTALPMMAAAAARPRRIALMHLAPVPGDLAGNRERIEHAVAAVAAQGADWVVTPELCVSGYDFARRIGTEWIGPQPDVWTQRVCDQARTLGVTIFLSQPERDSRSGLLHNAVFVIGMDGKIAGSHRKVLTLRVGSEAWSSPGDDVKPVRLSEFGNVGVMICADASDPSMAMRLKAREARILVAPSAWGRGLHEPSGEWERRTADTGLPLVVCNRTGIDGLDFRQAESVVAKDGRRLLSLTSETPVAFLIDWNAEEQAPAGREPRRMALPQ